MTGVPLTLGEFEPAQRRRAEALILARILWPFIQSDEALRIADYVIRGHQ